MWELEEAHGGLFRALLARRRKVRRPARPVGSPLGRLTSFANGIETLPQGARRRASGAGCGSASPLSSLALSAGTPRGGRFALDAGESFTPTTS